MWSTIQHDPPAPPDPHVPVSHQDDRGTRPLLPFCWRCRMTTYGAVCTDCGWSYESGEYEPVADELERHSRKEHHHVEFTRNPVTATA